jgi:hypothetical protein
MGEGPYEFEGKYLQKKEIQSEFIPQSLRLRSSRVVFHERPVVVGKEITIVAAGKNKNTLLDTHHMILISRRPE